MSHQIFLNAHLRSQSIRNVRLNLLKQEKTSAVFVLRIHLFHYVQRLLYRDVSLSIIFCLLSNR